MDIFERNPDRSIVVEQNGKLKIHTVVLYMQENDGKSQVLVIDPSNSDFSKHLAYNSDIIFGYDSIVQILAHPTELKIYSPPAKVSTGPNPDQPRDCTDVAVKIAFGLEKHVGAVDIEQLSELRFIKEITNQDGINRDLLFEPVEAMARIRQASEDNVREKAQKLLVSLFRQSKCANTYEDKVLSSKICAAQTKEFGVLYPSDKYDDQLLALSKIHDSNIDLIGQMMKDMI